MLEIKKWIRNGPHPPGSQRLDQETGHSTLVICIICIRMTRMSLARTLGKLDWMARGDEAPRTIISLVKKSHGFSLQCRLRAWSLPRCKKGQPLPSGSSQVGPIWGQVEGNSANDCWSICSILSRHRSRRTGSLVNRVLFPNRVSVWKMLAALGAKCVCLGIPWWPGN